MRKAALSLSALFLASLLVACHGESITSPPMGGASLSGQVVTTGDLAGASPAGISVTCSGQVSVTDASGRFAFASIAPESMGRLAPMATGNFNMHFSRGDGIDASGTASASSSNVTVFLQKTQATVMDNSSGSNNNNGGGQTQELEGPITAISASSITVNNASTHGDVKAAINGSTVIRKGNQTLTWKDLHLGDRVHVKTSGSGDSLVATEIMLQNPA